MKLKKLLVLLPLFLTIPAISGCGDDGKIHITFWHTMGKELQANPLDYIIKEFEAANPGIKIDHTQKGGYDDIYENISQAIPAGTTPTMAYCYPDHVADYNTSKACLDLTQFINDPELGFSEEDGPISDIISAYWQEGQEYLDDGIYSVPHCKSTEMIFYNKDVFTAKGWTIPGTWEELEELFETIKNDPDYAGKEDFVPFGYDSDANFFITMCEQYGIPYTHLDKANNRGSADFNNLAAKKMVTKLQEWYNKGYLKTQGTSGGAYTSTQFSEGKLLITVGSTGGTKYNYNENFETAVAQMPHPSEDASKRFDFFTGTDVTPLEGANNNHIIMQGPSICFFKKGTQEQKVAAWKFYKYLIKTMNSAAWSVESGYSSVRKSSFECDKMVNYLADENQVGKYSLIQKTLSVYTELSERYFVSPAFPGSTTCRSEVDGILSNVFMGTKDLNKAFADAQAKAVFAIQ